MIRGIRLLALVLALGFGKLNLHAQSKIIFARGKGGLNTGETPDLMLLDPATGAISTLLKGSVPRRGEGNAALSPDKSQIIFNTYRYRGWKLAIADFKNGEISNIRRFTKRPNYEYNASWSHDGKQVVYTEYNWGTDKSEMFIRDQQSGKVRKVATNQGTERTPYWTRDDQQLVYVSQGRQSADIFIVKPDGSGKQNLSNHPSHDMAPSCSPSEDRVAFLSNRTGSLHLYIMDTNGKKLKDITPDLGSDPFKYDNWQNSGSWGYKTSWSPDGKQIVFTVMKNGDLELFVINADGTGLKQLTDNRDADFTPFWTN